MAQTIIHIFGPSGSGTTSLGRQMALNWGFRQLDSDDFYWLPTDPPFTSKRPPEQRLEQMEQALAQGGDLVVSGSLGRAADPFFYSGRAAGSSYRTASPTAAATGIAALWRSGSARRRYGPSASGIFALGGPV